MFDRYLQETKPNWKRRALATASVALHIVAGISLVIYSFFHIEEVTPPVLSLTFFSAAAPPPPPPPPPPKKSSTKTKPKVTPTQPTTITQLVQPKQEDKAEEEQ